MTTEDALLEAVLESPEDDVVRLVYADRLDEVGRTEEALFIRRQVHLASGVKCNRDDRPVGTSGVGRMWRPHCRCHTCTTARRVEESLKARKDYGEKYLRIARPAWWWAEVAPSLLPDVRPDVAHLQPRAWLKWKRGLPHSVSCNDTFARHGFGVVLRENPVEEVFVSAGWHNDSMGDANTPLVVFIKIEKVNRLWKVSWNENFAYATDRFLMANRVNAIVHELFPA